MNEGDSVRPDFCLAMQLATGRDVVGRDSSRHVGMNPDLRFDHLLFFGLIAALFLQPISATAACRFKSISDISFGVYDVFSALPNTSGVGSLSISCSGDGDHEHSNFDVTLSTGQSNNYAYRIMKNGSNSLNYNLYTNAARTVVWGNGTGSSSVMSASRNSSTMLSIFGLIPDGQDVAFGTYTDSITASVNF